MDGPYSSSSDPTGHPGAPAPAGDGARSRAEPDRGRAAGEPQAAAMHRLKELLFERENREIGSLTEQIAELQRRAGSDAQFQRSVAAVLDGAIRDAEQTRHLDLADAMAPMVVRTLHAEMSSKDMQDRIAGTMYPRLGEMVQLYVASAVRDMMAKINRSLDSSLGLKRLILRLRSITTGHSMAELALFDAQRLAVSEIYLVRRGSGALVHHWRRPGSPDISQGNNRDTLVSGFLAAITAFAEEAFEADKESLRTLDLNDDRIYLRGTPDYLLAARCTGTAPTGIERDLDAELRRVLAEQAHLAEQASVPGGEPISPAARDSLLASFAGNIEEASAARVRELTGGPYAALKVLLWFVGVPLAALAGWYFYVSWTTADLQARADGALARIETLKGYPIRAIVERGGGRIWVSGLAPDEASHRRALADVKALAPAADVNDAVGVLPKSDLDARLGAESLRRSLGRAELKLKALAADLSSVRERLADAADREAIARAGTETNAALAEIAHADVAAAPAGLVPPLRDAVATLRATARRLSTLAGVEPAPDEQAPEGATEAADALAQAGDRITAALAALEQRRNVAPLNQRVDAVAARADDLDRRLAARIAELEQRLRSLQPPPPTARERLQAFVRTNAIFFASDADYRDPAAAAATLDTLARLVKEANVYLRVVGYTDEAGNASRNSPLSQIRADKVVADLVARGAPRDLLLGVGRANLLALAPGTGTDSPNRRVEFELTFAGEKGSRP